MRLLIGPPLQAEVGYDPKREIEKTAYLRNQNSTQVYFRRTINNKTELK